MDFEQMVIIVRDVQEKYRKLNSSRGNKRWEAAEYMQGFMGDVGMLAKLIMAKNNYRNLEDVDQKLKEELADCLYAVIVIASELNIDLESGFVENMKALKDNVEKHP